MPTAQPKIFARGYSFTGAIDGHSLGWTKARVVFDYRNGTERTLFEFECGLELIDTPDDEREVGLGERRPAARMVNPRLERFARPGEDTHVEIVQLDRSNNVVGSWRCSKARLVEYSVAWDNQADQVTPERIVFEAPAGSTVTGAA